MGRFSQWAKRPAWPISITSPAASFFNLQAALSPTSSSLLLYIHPLSFFLSLSSFPPVCSLFHICFLSFWTRGIKHLNPRSSPRTCGGKLSIYYPTLISHLIITNTRWLEEHGWTVSPSLLLGLPSSTFCWFSLHLSHF